MENLGMGMDLGNHGVILHNLRVGEARKCEPRSEDFVRCRANLTDPLLLPYISPTFSLHLFPSKIIIHTSDVPSLDVIPGHKFS